MTMQKPIDFDDTSDGESTDVDSVTSFPLFSPAPTEVSMTSFDVSMRSSSPARSVLSVTSSLRRQAYIEEYGRGLNNYSEVYRLPADDDELERLDKQHGMLQKVMGGYPPPMEQVMADNIPGEVKAVIDLGCGSGSWILDVARDFPTCSAIGVDLVPMQVTSMPANCRSEVDDINIGLEHFYGDFNVVHARLISSGIRDYERLIDQMSHVLRPGGLLCLTEFDFSIYDANHQRIELTTDRIEAPYVARWFAFAKAAARRRGGDVDAANHLRRWVSSNPRFENVVYRHWFLPTLPYHKDAFHQEIGAVMRDDVLEFMRSGRPLLLGSGMPKEQLDDLQAKVIKEIIDENLEQYVHLEHVYATKVTSR
ncbi:hypothetical protein FISHEDRAFT_66490 [Fistulina hepatica ATCC 64428]|uniref:S-adenosyl-L-methionine-dependent methyltransferase n=1 Tax=Fistulina hepatica ATCC 64428 TaxID=1128425 RepID=A0A0D7A689_9AGAR|nr:hypothetical protein FISHEDRAFT_66490 [Fistulina hepatica ATCC 64428]